MRRCLPLLAFLGLALAGWAGPAPAATKSAADPAPAQAETATAAVEFDAAVDALAEGYLRLVPEAATYNGAPESVAPGAGGRLNDRSLEGERARNAELETLLAGLRATPAAASSTKGDGGS